MYVKLQQDKSADWHANLIQMDSFPTRQSSATAKIDKKPRLEIWHTRPYENLPLTLWLKIILKCLEQIMQM